MQKRSTEKSVEKKKHLRTSHKAYLSERKTVIHAVEDCKTTITYDEEEKKPETERGEYTRSFVSEVHHECNMRFHAKLNWRNLLNVAPVS